MQFRLSVFLSAAFVLLFLAVAVVIATSAPAGPRQQPAAVPVVLPTETPGTSCATCV